MRYGSICSGIESASVAWESLGWSPAWFSEIEAFPSAVLAYRWPHVTNLGDMCNLPAMLDIGLIEAPDVLVGGTPCQAFSVAGLRGGLTDDRGLLTLKYIEVANAIDRQRGEGDECVVVWENVPGVLSSKDNAFGHFLAGLVGEEEPLRPPGGRWLNAGCVYGPQRQAAWRVLDAQYFGVAQRRRRVFVVASGRDGFSPAEVLFEFEGVRRDTPPSRETGQGVAGNFEIGPGRNSETEIAPTLNCRSKNGPIQNQTGLAIVQKWPADVASLLDASFHNAQGIDDQHINGGAPLFVPDYIIMAHGQGGAEINTKGKSRTLTCNHEAPIVCHGMQDPCVSDKAFALGRNGGRENVLAFAQNTRDEVRYINGDGQIVGALSASPGMKQQNYIAFEPGLLKRKGSHYGVLSPTLRARMGDNQPAIAHGATVRRLTPRECERLQGFPDDYTLIPWRGKPAEDCPDGPRYKAIGNSKAVPVIKWIGERINAQTIKTQ